MTVVIGATARQVMGTCVHFVAQLRSRVRQVMAHCACRLPHPRSIHGVRLRHRARGHIAATLYHSVHAGRKPSLQELITALDKAPADDIDVKYSTLLALTKGCDDILFIQRLARSSVLGPV